LKICAKQTQILKTPHSKKVKKNKKRIIMTWVKHSLRKMRQIPTKNPMDSSRHPQTMEPATAQDALAAIQLRMTCEATYMKS
jgi:hypothetical protein